MKKRQDQPCSKFWALESGSCDSIHYDASPGGGGGGCASRKTLIFFPKFLLQSIFSLMTTTKNPQEHHHFTVFAALETIIFKMSVPVSPSIATHGPFTEGAEHKMFLQHSGLQLARVPAIRFLQISSRDPPIHVWACSGAPHLHAWACCGALQFHARLAPKPPFFTLLWHRPTTIWTKVPPPPPWC